jgi:hypothetical protein
MPALVRIQLGPREIEKTNAFLIIEIFNNVCRNEQEITLIETS